MLERFDHRPILTALLALATAVLVVVVITLATLLITAPPAPTSSSVSDGGKPAAPKEMDAGDAGWYGEVYGNIQPKAAQNCGAAAAPANMDAGGENYGWDSRNRAVCSVELARAGHGCWEGQPSQP